MPCNSDCESKTGGCRCSGDAYPALREALADHRRELARLRRVEVACRSLLDAIDRAECAQNQPAWRNAREDWGVAEDALRSALTASPIDAQEGGK